MQHPSPIRTPAAGILRRIAGMVAACALLQAGGVAHAETAYPGRAVRVVVPSTPGVVPDALTRLIAQKLAEIWGVPVVVENRPGASGLVAAAFVAKSEPDGYTILFGDSSLWAINPHVYSKLPYDPLNDFAPVIGAAHLPMYLTVNASSPMRTVRDLIGYAKKNPGKLAYSTPGAGSSGNLAGEMFSSMAGVQLLHVPYKGSEGIKGLLANDVQLAIYGQVAVVPQVKAGNLRILAGTMAERSPTLPDVPTVAESGVPGYDISSTFGAMVPAATPPALVARINADIVKALADPDVIAKFNGYGTPPIAKMTPAQFGTIMRGEYEKFGKLVRETGMKLE
ncbi:MAG: tripartite tricarboxylate transporter substrate binding protein [Pigmentiphaga sp.]|uniref:Bug family tripartite tricarboxylate transporter substrate binding protein n=1 Tax=Pigmentiphaga sp. TaxID=1977564 RepID=UPI0029A5D2C9|nr:tripartite tricarboxylate transporter substrate binding protein [Pigmentiphaga sp.]MDX3907978.1 tripartite tricarboxylate transporter substrate binding protein [Pigmentiphaga sp.]